jgi:hypothetical protein
MSINTNKMKLTSYISKSDYQVGRRCLKRLWHEKYNRWITELSATDKKNAFEGHRFNDAVRELFPDGIMVGWEHGSAEAAASKTAEHLKKDTVTLFEAFFLHEGLMCLADVVVKTEGKIKLIEAKASNNPKITKKDDFEHIHDVAFQAYVMNQCGFKPDEILLLHANGECVWPDKTNLFSFVDLTEEAVARFDEVETASARILRELKSEDSPEQAIGKFCKKPEICPHIDVCWSLPVEKTIYDLPRMSDAKLSALESENIHLIEDIPSSADLSDAQWEIVHLIQDEVEFVDKYKVQELIERLEYPIHFFDFETYNAAVPMWNQSRPWQQVPFQYSLHILYENGDLVHFEFLHTEKSDPRPALISAMKEHLLKFGSVVVYYAPFEKTRIKELAMDFPEYAGFLTSINNRIWDQLDVFKHCFRDHRLALSKSIKVVLPTFVPELSYKDLNVQKGDQAQLEWRNMIELESEALKRNRVADLKAYCKLDTLAMVELHKFIKAIAER